MSHNSEDTFDAPVPIPEPSIQSMGGHARAAALSPERRREIGKAAANARWGSRYTEITLPLSESGYAVIPYPMTDEDFELLVATLNLWRKRLTAANSPPPDA